MHQHNTDTARITRPVLAQQQSINAPAQHRHSSTSWLAYSISQQHLKVKTHQQSTKTTARHGQHKRSSTSQTALISTTKKTAPHGQHRRSSTSQSAQTQQQSTDTTAKHKHNSTSWPALTRQHLTDGTQA